MVSGKALVRSVIPAEASQSASDGELGERIEGLTRRFDQMLRLMDEQLHLQKVALLEGGHVLRFHSAEGVPVALSLPDAQDDYVQRVILKTRTFYEAKVLAAVQALNIVGPASVVCDVGANIGNHTVHFALCMGAGRVLAFEPLAHCHEVLCRNIGLNGLSDQVVAYNCMIGASTGNGALSKFNPRNLGGTCFDADDTGPVPMFALDDAITAEDLARLDLVKIDVEGRQMAVLEGAAGILHQRKPALWIELLERDGAYAATAAMLEPMGYAATRLAPNNFLFRARGA